MVSTLKAKGSQVICLTNVNIPQRYCFIRLSNLDIFSDNKMTAEISAVKVHSKANCVKGDLKVECDYLQWMGKHSIIFSIMCFYLSLYCVDL